MLTKGLSFKEVFVIAGAYCAFLIGSSFATGQEILQYFAAHGLLGFGTILVSAFIFTWTGSTLVKWGNQNKGKNDAVFEYYCGKAIGKFLKYFVPAFLFGVIVMMIAGTGAIFTDYLGLSKYLGVGIMALMILLTALLGLKKLVDILGFIGPVIIVFLLIVGIISLFLNFSGLGEVQTILANVEPPRAVGQWWLSGILYAAATILTAAPFLAGMGETVTNKRSSFLGGLTGGLAVSSVILIITLALLANMDKIFDASAPMVTLTNEFFASVSIFFAVIIFLGVYTTATPMVWLISSAFVNEKSKWYKMLVAVVTILGLVGGYLLPFGTIVGFLYTYAGYFGIFFLLAMAYKQIKNKLFAKQVEGPDQEISID